MARLTGQDSPEQLTPREREVMDLLRQGLSDSEIGGRLGISRAGASYHVSEIIGKLNVGNRHEAAAWPDRPPWWAAGIAPVALLWRKAAGGLPGPAGAVALAVSIGLFSLVLAGAGFMAFLLLRSSGETYPALTEIAIPQDAIAALDSYEFTSRLEVTSAEGDSSATFDGAFQAPNRTQGVLSMSGQLAKEWENSGRPADIEVIVVGEYSWVREAGGDWWPGLAPGGDSVEPIVWMTAFGTPQFYLEALRFDSLVMPVGGAAETVNGVRAYPVRLDKPAIVDLLQQGTAIKRYPYERDEHGPVYPGLLETAQEVLPDDFLAEVWVEGDELYPARITFSFSVAEGESCAFCWGFERPMSLRLKMHITDPDAGVEIEPVVPIPTLTPVPTTPPGELTGEEESRIMEIVSIDPRLDEIAGGKIRFIGVPDFVWRTSELEVLGGAIHITIDEPFTYEGGWPSIVYDETETTDPPFREVEVHYRAEGIERLRVLVYLPEERVVEIVPDGAVISNRTPPAPD